MPINCSRRSLLLSTANIAALAAFSADIRAQPGVVKIIVPYAPGAATDALARMLAQGLEASLGNKFLVENRAGGGSQIGTKAIAAAAGDGTTLGFVDTAFVINPALVGAALPYDTRKDFVPLSLVATAPFVLLVHSNVPARSIKELAELAKSKSGLSYGSAGIGSAPHLAGEQLKMATGAPFTHVPYRGGSTVLNDLIGGHVQFAFTTVPTMIEHIKSGSVRAIAVTGGKRAAQLPDVQTTAEAGMAAVDAAPLFGLIAPAGLSPAMVERLGRSASTLVRPGGGLHQRLIELGFLPVGSTPDEFSARVDDEIRKWTEVVRNGNIKP